LEELQLDKSSDYTTKLTQLTSEVVGGILEAMMSYVVGAGHIIEGIEEGSGDPPKGYYGQTISVGCVPGMAKFFTRLCNMKIAEQESLKESKKTKEKKVSGKSKGRPSGPKTDREKQELIGSETLVDLLTVQTNIMDNNLPHLHDDYNLWLAEMTSLRLKTLRSDLDHYKSKSSVVDASVDRMMWPVGSHTSSKNRTHIHALMKQMMSPIIKSFSNLDQTDREKRKYNIILGKCLEQAIDITSELTLEEVTRLSS